MNNKIVCIYPVDKTTDFLLPIFERLKLEPGFVDYHFDTNDTSLVKSMKEDLSKLDIQSCFVFFLGHGASHCLYGTPLDGNEKKQLFSVDDVHLFKDFNCFFLSCRSRDFCNHKQQAYIGFGDIPTDYSEIMSERDLGDINYLNGIEEADIEFYKQVLVDAIIQTIEHRGCASLFKFYKIMKLYINKQIVELLISKNQHNYRLIADLLYSLKSEIEYHR